MLSNFRGEATIEEESSITSSVSIMTSEPFEVEEESSFHETESEERI